MTTEVAVMNKQAVALAADSAGTVAIGKDSEKREKIYFSENKLFALSKYQPVGIMVYQNAEFMEVPFEIIVKQYRKNLGKKSFATLEEYAKDFIAYIDTETNIFPESAQDRFYMFSAIDFLGKLNSGWKNLKSKEISKKINETIDKMTQATDLQDLPKNKVKEIIKKYNDVIHEFINTTSFIKLSETNKRKLMHLCALCATKQTNYPRGNYAGVVIAGYGESELFPSVEAYRLYGKFDGIFKYIREDEKSEKITRDNNVSIAAFAQRDVVATFMEGIDPDYKEVLFQNIEVLIEGMSSKIIQEISSLDDENKQKLSEVFKLYSEEPLKNFRQAMNDFGFENHVRPIITNTQFLGKEALAEIAETLVNITSFMRKSSMVAETVGGPVDVAVISKADGFIWIKRKHYFKPELNHHFFNNYFSNEGGEDD
jgi:hypothetical protein